MVQEAFQLLGKHMTEEVLQIFVENTVVVNTAVENTVVVELTQEVVELVQVVGCKMKMLHILSNYTHNKIGILLL